MEANKPRNITRDLVDNILLIQSQFVESFGTSTVDPVALQGYDIPISRIVQAIKRSNKFPNCSYFTHWVNKQDAITWDVEVKTTGRYAVTVEYACSAADIGSTIQLRAGDSTLSAKLTVPHDPPLRGMENDREPRGESFVKDFKALHLGDMSLPAGRGTLVLEALDKPGETVMEVRTIWLRLLDAAPVK